MAIEHAHHQPHARPHRHHYDADMLSVEEALERILGFFQVLEAEEKPILDALGQVLAEDAVAGFDLPPADNSAMDGYAVRHADITGAGPDQPKVLTVIGLVAAGQLPVQEVRSGTAIRIMTGALIPPGADTVIPFEETDELERTAAGRPLDEIAILREVSKGDSVRPAAEDVRRGEIILPKGTVLRPSEVGVLASLGNATVNVGKRPVVAVLATGERARFKVGQPDEFRCLRPGDPVC